MQCQRCYFDNRTDATVCEYCGAALQEPTEAPKAGNAAEKRRTLLGPPPGREAWTQESAPASRVDPDDPFRLAATGVVGGAAAEVRSVPLEEAVEAQQDAEPSDSVPQTPRRSTIIEREAVVDTEILGVLLVLPPEGAPPPYTRLLRAGRTRIGRDADNDLVLTDPRVSGDHGILRLEPGSAWLLDTSSNGTVVSGHLHVNDRVDLEDGSVLLMGRTTLVVKLLSDDTLGLLRNSEG